MSLLAFTNLVLGYEKVNPHEHGHLLHTLENLVPSIPQQIVLILFPRNSYKTTIASVAYPMWLLNRDPNLSILVDSETYNLSKSIVSEIKQQYMSGPYTRHCPPVNNKEGNRWAEDSIILPQRTRPQKEGSINAAGIDGVKAGMHYDFIIADDLHSQNNTRSQSQIQQVVEHYRLLLSILKPDGVFVVIGTRWSTDDAYDVIKKDCTKYLFIPAVSTLPMNLGSTFHPVPPPTPDPKDPSRDLDPPARMAYVNSANDAEPVTEYYLNFPQTLPVIHLDKMEQRQGPYIYSAQYLLNPVEAQQRRFRTEWIKFYRREADGVTNENKDRPLPPKGTRRVGFVDPAFTTSDYADYSGIVIITTDKDRNAFILHAEQKRVEPTDLLELLDSLNNQYDVDEWFIEEVAAQKVLRFFIDYRNRTSKTKLVATPVKSFGRKKILRIMSLQPYFQAGKFLLHPDQEDLLYQLNRFPIIKNDDLIDALAYAPPILFEGMAFTPKKELPENCYARLLQDNRPSRYTGIRPLNYAPPRTFIEDINDW